MIFPMFVDASKISLLKQMQHILVSFTQKNYLLINGKTGFSCELIQFSFQLTTSP